MISAAGRLLEVCALLYKLKGLKEDKNPNSERAAKLEHTEIIRLAQLHHHEGPSHVSREYGSSVG
jgi:hypothetical protein